jgi:hypothetical protein
MEQDKVIDAAESIRSGLAAGGLSHRFNRAGHECNYKNKLTHATGRMGEMIKQVFLFMAQTRW